MASSDWTVLTGVLSTGDVARGVTSGPTKPTGGGSFVYALNSLTNTVGVVALHTNQVNFSPMAKGGDIRAAMRRGLSGGTSGWSVFTFLALSGTNVSDTAYLLGIANGDPSHICLRKGALSGGLPDETPLGVNKILRRSTEVVAIDQWVHLRLEMVFNTNGDTILNCYKNLGNVTTPTWVPIPGMDPFVDDVAGIASGSLPYTSGRAGFGYHTAEVTRRAYIDHVEVLRQL